MAKQAEKYLLTLPWGITEKGFHAEKNQVSESIFSLGNEYSGVRGYMEEGVSAPSLQGAYFNGVYEWARETNGTAYKGIIKRGHYMVNAVDFLKTEIIIDGIKLDIGKETPADFERSLDFKTGVLTRSYTVKRACGDVKLTFTRFLSMTECDNSYQQIVIESQSPVTVEAYLGLDFATLHGGKEGRWGKESSAKLQNGCYIVGKTESTNQRILSMQKIDCQPQTSLNYECSELSVGNRIKVTVDKQLKITKHIRNVVDKSGSADITKTVGDFGLDYAQALEKNKQYFAEFWRKADIEIEGDEDNQQGIRFCLFQLLQTYHGLSPKDNIGAKGLTGEAYNGHAFWDTETYCLPFYLFNNLQAAKDLLLFRYNTLNEAKERAKMLDCEGACYPIATLNGGEACDLWQHASLQFQPSTGVAYGIYHYVRVSGDEQFLLDYGMEMLLEICRFLRSRGDFSADGTKFGFYCVMGPDEFQMMVNHNCYTNYMAKKTFEYSLSVFEKYKNTDAFTKLGVQDEELQAFCECAEKTYLPKDEKSGVYEQHEGYFNLPHVDIKSIPITDFPLYHHWSYDRIYRNDMIKQPDVLMFMLLYSGDFSIEEKLANYEFYEPRTIHESSLSPSVHSILASELGKDGEALSFFGFASRLDLDDYNRNTSEGLHTTSLAAAWLNIVYGFGGVRSDGEMLVINPRIPPIWKAYSFRLNYRGSEIIVRVSHKNIEIAVNGQAVNALVLGRQEELIGVRLFER